MPPAGRCPRQHDLSVKSERFWGAPRTTARGMATMGRNLAIVPTLVALALHAGAAFACTSDADCNAPFGNPCSRSSCINGECGPLRATNCSDGDACTDDGCNPNTGCFHTPTCPSDGLACNGEEFCARFPFAMCLRTAPDCNDGNACTIDSCAEPGGCRHVALNCADGDQCTRDTCDPNAGCVNEAIENCCRTAADCPSNRCTERLCTAARCSAGTPISCDDGDASTVDACDVTSGCTHDRPPTTTTLPKDGGGSCTVVGDCPTDDDPCTEERCVGGRCAAGDATGFDALGCVCRRPSPTACAGQSYPRKLARRAKRACGLVETARGASIKRRGRLALKAGRQFDMAKLLAIRAGATGALTKACGDAASAQMTDGASRAAAIRGGS